MRKKLAYLTRRRADEWNAYSANGNSIPMGSFFRVQNGRLVAARKLS